MSRKSLTTRAKFAKKVEDAKTASEEIADTEAIEARIKVLDQQINDGGTEYDEILKVLKDQLNNLQKTINDINAKKVSKTKELRDMRSELYDKKRKASNVDTHKEFADKWGSFLEMLDTVEKAVENGGRIELVHFIRGEDNNMSRSIMYSRGKYGGRSQWGDEWYIGDITLNPTFFSIQLSKDWYDRHLNEESKNKSESYMSYSKHDKTMLPYLLTFIVKNADETYTRFTWTAGWDTKKKTWQEDNYTYTWEKVEAKDFEEKVYRADFSPDW